MPLPVICPPTLVLPTVWVLGTETELVNDLVVHTSVDIYVEPLLNKTLHILASEVVIAGVPGNLWIWVELSPYPSTLSTAYWSAIGGGGGALPPLAPQIVGGTGVNGTVQTVNMAWVMHSPYARVVVQTPVAAALPAAFWAVQVLFSGQAV
jgi:hypothetical protein